MLPLVVPAWETFRETTLLHPRWHQRKGQIKQGRGGVELEITESAPGASLPCLSGRMSGLWEGRLSQ